jgi:hypothetical protein
MTRGIVLRRLAVLTAFAGLALAAAGSDGGSTVLWALIGTAALAAFGFVALAGAPPTRIGDRRCALPPSVGGVPLRTSWFGGRQAP